MFSLPLVPLGLARSLSGCPAPKERVIVLNVHWTVYTVEVGLVLMHQSEFLSVRLPLVLPAPSPCSRVSWGIAWTALAIVVIRSDDSPFFGYSSLLFSD